MLVVRDATFADYIGNLLKLPATDPMVLITSHSEGYMVAVRGAGWALLCKMSRVVGKSAEDDDNTTLDKSLMLIDHTLLAKASCWEDRLPTQPLLDAIEAFAFRHMRGGSVTH